jgi:hypothetical protein
MICPSLILTFLVATANAANMRGSSETNVVVDRSASLVCPSQDEIFKIINEPQRPGSYEDGLQCDFEYRLDNDLKCTPSAMCSFNNDMWNCIMEGIWCDPEIAQCGDVCEQDNTRSASLLCPSQDAIDEILNDPQPDGLYEDGLQCDFEYRFDNDLKCTPLTMCSFNTFNDNTWVCAMSGIWCDLEIEYEVDQAQCGYACEPEDNNPIRY